MFSQYLELLNATLGLSLLLVILISIRDFKDEILKRSINVKITIILFGLGIFSLSIKEIYKSGSFDPVIAELLETLSLLFMLGAFFSLLRSKELHPLKIKR